MRAGKNAGVDDDCSDSPKHASDQFIDYIVSLFNSMLSHGCVPSIQNQIRFLIYILNIVMVISMPNKDYRHHHRHHLGQ